MRTFAALLLLSVAACSSPVIGQRREAITLHGDTRLPERCAVILFVDGLASGSLHRALEQGRLPAIRKRFVDGGVSVEHAVCALPSMTYPNTVSLLTGTWPGHHGIVGNEWFDRDARILENYARADAFRNAGAQFAPATLFEILDDELTINVQCHTARGADHTVDHWLSSGIDWWAGKHLAVDARVGSSWPRVAALANRQGRWPAVVLFYFPGVDETGHRYGPESAAYALALENVDRAIGRICDTVARSALAERTTFVLMSDHGAQQIPSDRTWEVEDWLTRRGLIPRTGRVAGSTRVEREQRFRRADVVVAHGAGRQLALHVRGAMGWDTRASSTELQALTDALIEEPAVDVVLRRDGESVLLCSPRGRARIQRHVDGSAASYRLDNEQGDVLGYAAHAAAHELVGSGWHDSRTWLLATATSSYPDAVPQVAEMFDSPRSADLVVTAAAGWGFAPGEAGGHGGFQRGEVRIPLYFAGPDLPPAGSVDTARIVDIMPTLLELLGQETRLRGRPLIDGVSIAPQLRSSRGMGPTSALPPASVSRSPGRVRPDHDPAKRSSRSD